MEDIIHTDLRTAISFILLMFLTFFVGKQINSHKNGWRSNQKKNLTQKYSMNWIKQEFKKRNLNIDEIQYAVIGTNGQLYVDLYSDKLHSPTKKK